MRGCRQNKGPAWVLSDNAAAAHLLAFCCTARRVLIWARVRSKEKMPCTREGRGGEGQGVLYCSVLSGHGNREV